MKEPDYRIRITSTVVSVQHRVKRPPWELCILVPAYGLIIYFNGGFRIMAALVRSGDWGLFCLALVLSFAFVLLFGWSWLIYSTGEFLHCDLNECHTGKRRVWIRWRRGVFTRQSVSRLERAGRGGSKTRSYTVLTFQVAGKRRDILEDLPLEQAVSVLKACKSLGYDCILPEVFPNHDGPMKADIEKHGWFVNPWRPDQPSEHQKQ